MNKLKHTPGPWVPIFGLPSEKIYGMGNGKVNIINTGGISRYRSVEGQANARLIAAAPDMLEALINAYCNMDSGNFEEIESVVEKATGMSITKVLEILNEN